MLIYKADIEEIELDLTGSCNLSCPLCTRNYTHANHLLKKLQRPIEEIKSQLDEYINLKRFFVAGAVSEPTLYKNFFKFIKYLNDRNIHYELFTNGSARNKKWWKELGEIIPKECPVIFTVCGSTPKLHAKYRVGSSLEKLLENARAFRENKKGNDVVQHIKFEYNALDLDSGSMDCILKEFSQTMFVETEGVRRINKYNKTFDKDIKPLPVRERTIKSIFKNRAKPDDGQTYQINCKSLSDKKIYINNFGKVSACYIHAEFEKKYFENEVFDYSKILAFSYPDCFLCEKRTRTIIEKTGLNFVC